MRKTFPSRLHAFVCGFLEQEALGDQIVAHQVGAREAYLRGQAWGAAVSWPYLVGLAATLVIAVAAV